MKKLHSYLRQQLKEEGVTLSHQVGEVDLVYKRKIDIHHSIRKIGNSRDVEKIFRSSYDEGQIEHREYFKIILLSTRHLVLGIVTISQGGITGTVADIRVMYQAALLCNATSIVLCHNHPSGNMQPSQSDIALTRKIKEAGLILELQVLDHIILGYEDDCFYSFADEGML